MIDRQTGRTTRQMMDAKKGALFVWCVGNCGYARELARKIGREDLVIIGPEEIDRMNGRVFPEVVVDHAFPDHATDRDYEGIAFLRTRIR